jgi:hypothetical protein
MNTRSAAFSPSFPPNDTGSSWIARVVQAVALRLQASRDRRAQAELHAIADECEAYMPSMAQELRAASARSDIAEMVSPRGTFGIALWPYLLK